MKAIELEVQKSEHKKQPQEEFVAVALIDLSVCGLYIYDVPKELDHEETEEWLGCQGHHMSDCSWGVFDGDITDLRGDNGTEVEEDLAKE